MTPLAFLGDFGSAIEFLFVSRESQTGGVQIGGREIWLEMLPRHLLLSGVAIAVACVVSIPISLWLGHIRKGRFIATTVANTGRAVPSFALIALFVAFLGVGFTNVALALVLLAIPPILTNTYVGVVQVDRETVDAARGMGMTGAQIVRKVELPMALPLIFGGLRISAVNVVATATIAPIAGYVTLGNPIINAQVYDTAGRLGAAIAVALLAVGADFLFGWLQRAVTPRGLQLAQPRRRSFLRRIVSSTQREVPTTP